MSDYSSDEAKLAKLSAMTGPTLVWPPRKSKGGPEAYAALEREHRLSSAEGMVQMQEKEQAESRRSVISSVRKSVVGAFGGRSVLAQS